MLAAIATAILVKLAASFPIYTEILYAQGIYPYISKVLTSLSKIVPFSIDDVFYITLILLFFICILLVVFKKMTLKFFFVRVIQTISICYILFYWLWGFNYYRQDAYSRLNMERTNNKDELFESILQAVIDNANSNYCSIEDYDKEKSISAIETSYQSLASQLEIDNLPLSIKPKHITFSSFFAKATILGYYGPFFNEIQINKYLTPWDEPSVIGHEKAHQLGITSEAEASFYGWMACINSKDQFTRYSAWLFVLNYFLREAKHLENYPDYLKAIKPEIVNDLVSKNKHWRQWQNKNIDRVASKVNDTYLKSNNVNKGIKDYNEIVALIIDYSQNNHGNFLIFKRK